MLDNQKIFNMSDQNIIYKLKINKGKIYAKYLAIALSSQFYKTIDKHATQHYESRDHETMIYCSDVQ